VVRVLDAHALMTFLEKQPGHRRMEEYFIAALEKDELLLMTSVNLGEVYSIVLRECGRDKADEIEKIIRTLPVKIVDVNWSLAKHAARLKATHKIAYADAFSAALAKIHKGEVITGDRKFRAVEDEVKVAWLHDAA
jgi:uncharacterized protein